jgi:hypothetical protein
MKPTRRGVIDRLWKNLVQSSKVKKHAAINIVTFLGVLMTIDGVLDYWIY